MSLSTAFVAHRFYFFPIESVAELFSALRNAVQGSSGLLPIYCGTMRNKLRYRLAVSRDHDFLTLLDAIKQSA
jgi:hypothetical protein